MDLAMAGLVVNVWRSQTRCTLVPVVLGLRRYSYSCHCPWFQLLREDISTCLWGRRAHEQIALKSECMPQLG
jgi:hypothetical protein